MIIKRQIRQSKGVYTNFTSSHTAMLLVRGGGGNGEVQWIETEEGVW